MFGDLTAIFGSHLPAVLRCLSTRLAFNLRPPKIWRAFPHRRFNQTIILPTSFLPPEMVEHIRPPGNRGLPTSQGKVSKWEMNHTACSTSCSRTARCIYSSRFALDSQVFIPHSSLYPPHLHTSTPYSLIHHPAPLFLHL